jgi:hypothetical protein
MIPMISTGRRNAFFFNSAHNENAAKMSTLDKGK